MGWGGGVGCCVDVVVREGFLVVLQHRVGFLDGVVCCDFLRVRCGHVIRALELGVVVGLEVYRLETAMRSHWIVTHGLHYWTRMVDVSSGVR